MKKSITTMLFAMVVGTIMGQVATQQPTVHERLGRGVVALPAQDKGIFVSWRLLGDDANDVRFDVVRNGKTIAKDIAATNFTDAEGRATSAYSIIAKQGGKKITSKEITPWNDIFYRMPIDRPEGGNTPDGKSYTYSPNDCSVGDVDGDGEYELVLKWEPSNAHDNAHDGYTGDVIFDCYKLTGKRLWRINLGRNIRAGAHYTQFLVYDFDGDGRAEMICKTAPGSIDGKGRYVTEAATEAEIRSIDNTADYRNSYGRILTGEELLTVFSGITGEALHTVWYNPNRAYGIGGKAEYAGWGDNARMGNRGERYLACVAHLDGIGRNASAVMCRGYYTRSYLWAVDFDGKRLSTKWLHASVSPEEWNLHDSNGKIVKSAKGMKATAYGQGAHSIAVADVDGDGCDEITYGSAAIDNDGSLLYSTGLGHGDAIHLSDLAPDRPGLEFYMVHEARPYGADLRDARTGEILFHEHANEDTGRGMCADIDPNHRGCEMWHICNKEVKDVKGNVISNTMPPMNFRIYWDGDLQEELLGNLDRRPLFPPCLYKWNGKEAEPMPLSNGKMLYEMGNSNSCNWTKATPNLQADIMGDWREELIFWDAKDASHLNIFTTNCPTEYRVPTLMHDHTYRMAVAWQNVCYNQPPHLGYYLPDAQVAKPMADVNKVVDNTLDSLNKAKTARIPAGTSRKGNNPVLFLIGNSTMRNGTLGNGNNGQWGWGYYAQDFFDEDKITVENQALGGMSSRTFYTRLWPDVRKGIRKGDWVIISIGHNDNGSYDSGRARASIPGIGKDTLNVTIKETGVKETVYTYGEYLRKYINDCRAVGANPILMSLTPRDAYDDNGRIVRVDKTFGLWARQVAEPENVPFVDLNEISASKLDAYGPWKEKYHFYTDHIHTSRFGAMMNARSAAEGIAESNDPKLAPLQAMMHNVELPTEEVKREKGKPVVFITGDSTVKNEDKDENGMWGWGSQAYTVFDQNKITCVNCAKAGRSTRTYLNEGRWDKVYNSLQSGDFVLIQFGHNDIGPIDNQKQRGTIACTKDTSHVYKLADSGKYEVVYSFGWYLKKFIQDVREKGATPILVSLTPRNEWPGGNVERRNDSYGKWYREVVKETGVEFVDVHNISADFLDRIGKEKAKEYFNHDHTHTSLTGAKMNAKSVAKGLMRNGSPLAKYLIAQTTIMEDMSKRDPKDNAPFYYSAELPDGNYKVTVVFGSKKKAGKTVVRAECRRLMVDEVSTKKGEFKTVEFTVNKRTPYISDLKSVKIKEREKGYLTWDDCLTLEFTGAAPAVKELRIERDTMATQIFLCGNSTVTDQPNEPYASWGQMAPVWFGSDVVIANHAESGLATSSFIAQGRLDQVVEQMKKGDYVLCEFGHNDQKERRAGSGAWYNFSHNLKEFIDRVRAKGGTIIFVTPTQRRAFDEATHTKIQETHGDYPDAMRAVARRENVPVIELHDMTRTFFETLGYEGSKESLVHYPANTFPGQTKALADNTHFNPYGAYEVAKMVIMGMKQLNLPIVKSLRQEWKDYDPSQPDDVKTFKWYPAQSVDVTKPAGN